MTKEIELLTIIPLNMIPFWIKQISANGITSPSVFFNVFGTGPYYPVRVKAVPFYNSVCAQKHGHTSV